MQGWDIIDRPWEMTLHHPLHAAGKCIIWLLFFKNIATCHSLMWFLCNVGYFLNPRYQYSDNVHNDVEVRAYTIDVIRRLAMNVDERIDAKREVYRCYI